MKTYYKILGLNCKASKQEITDAFIKLANSNEHNLSELSEAYEILIDPIKRHQYHRSHMFKMNINFTEPMIIYNYVMKKDINYITRRFTNKYKLYNDFVNKDDVTSSHVLCKYNW